MDKTVCQWFRELPLELRNRILHNSVKQTRGDMLSEEAMSMAQAIDISMNWRNTLEGKAYWIDIYEKYWVEGDLLPEGYKDDLVYEKISM